MNDQPALFKPAYAEPVDFTTQVDRMPGTGDADCLCDRDECAWPFCEWKEPDDAR